jgi:single-strand DNA-binding protein
MSGETPLTVIGNLTAAPEPHLAASGAMVASFTIASTPRTFDRSSNEWQDGETLFLRASVWGEAAKNAVASLSQGTRVVAHGVLKARSYETKNGDKRTVQELEIEELGVSVRYNLVTPHRADRTARAVEVPIAEKPAQVPARPHPVDGLTISPRPYDDDEAWFGKIANPSGNITPRHEDPAD